MDTVTLLKVFKAKKQRVDAKTGKLTQGFNAATFEQFTNWFKLDTFNKGCHYCGITNDESFKLYQLQIHKVRPDATRGGKRGKRLEIDRRDSFEPYDNLNNIVWCCYWCNNAKSNFFTEEEFKPIAINIGIALKKILQEHTNTKE